MADEDYFDEDELGYFYVEDAYAIADDLAEHQVASPVPYDGADEWDEDSRFEYWNDIEYDSDEYNDVETNIKKKSSKHSKSSPGKRKAPAISASPSKRRKTQQGRVSSSLASPVAWKPKFKVVDDIVAVEQLKSFSIFKDWRERFRHSEGFRTAKSDSDMFDIVEGVAVASMEEAEDEAADEDEDGTDGGLDPEILKMALRKNLESLGLDVANINEETLLQVAARMLANEGEADDILGELTEGLLGDEEEENDGDQFSQWVSKQVEKTAKDQTQSGSKRREMLNQPSASTDMESTKNYTHTPAGDSGILSLLNETPNAANGIDANLTPRLSRGVKRKADSPPSPSPKKANRARRQVRASS